MGRDKKFIIQYNIVALISCILLAILTAFFGKSNKKLWLLGAIGVLVLFTVAGVCVILRYLRDKRAEEARMQKADDAVHVDSVADADKGNAAHEDNELSFPPQHQDDC